MKKFLLLVLAIILIGGGAYGTYYFFRLKEAEVEINKSITDINEGDYNSAIERLKNIVSEYDLTAVKAPALYILADTYEKNGHFRQSLETHKILLSQKRIPVNNNWRIRSIVAVSRIYRNNLVFPSVSRSRILENNIRVINNQIDKKIRQNSSFFPGVWAAIEHFFYSIVSPNGSLFLVSKDDRSIISELKTELGFLYLAIEKYDDAERIFSTLQTRKGQFGLAQVYLKTSEYRRGIDILEDLLVYDTTGKLQAYFIQEIYEIAENLYEKKRYAEAVELFKKIETHAHSSNHAELASYRLARYYYRNGKYGSALAYINTLLKNTIHIKDEDASLLKGYIFYDKRDFIHALKIFNDFIKKYPESKNIPTAREWKAMCERSVKYFG